VDVRASESAAGEAGSTPESGRTLILMLTTSMAAGGSQRFLSFLLDHLDPSQFSVVVATMAKSDTDGPVPVGVPVLVIADEPAIAPPTVLDLPNNLRVHLDGDSAWVQILVDQIAHLVNRLRPDVVICAPEWIYLPAAAASARFPDSTALIGRFGAAASKAFPVAGGNPVLRGLAVEYLRNGGQIVSVSPAISEDLTQEFGVDPRRISLMHNVVDTIKISTLVSEPVDGGLFDDDIPTVLFVGRLERVKGLEYLLHAISNIAESASVRCVIVGEGSQSGYLRALVKHLGIAEHASFAGEQSNPYMYMSRATMFVLPSTSEGMPNVLLEAMACGCPVIATDIAGGVTRELLEDGTCGLIVPSGDSQALADAITLLLADPALRMRLEQEGLRRTLDFGLQGMIQQYADLFTAAAECPRVGDSPERAHPPTTPPRPTDGAPSRTQHMLSKTTRGLAALRRIGLKAVWLRARHKLQMTVGPFDPTADARSLRRIRAAAAASSRDTDRVRLLVLVPSMDDEFMGAGTDVLLRCIDRRVFDVKLVRILDSLDGGLVPGDVDAIVVQPIWASASVEAEGVPRGLCDRHRRELGWMDAKARGLGALSQELGADAILAQGFYASIIAILAAGQLESGVPIVAGMHSYARDFIGSWSQAELYGALVRACLSKADRVVVPELGIARDAADRFAVSPDRVVIIPDPVDVEQDRAAPQGSVARPWAEQGVPTFVCTVGSSADSAVAPLFEAVASANQRQAVRCLVVGAAISEADSRQAAERFGTGDAVRFLDQPESLLEYLEDASGYIHYTPDNASRLPSAIAVAVASGCPVITVGASSAGRRFVEGGRGILVRAGDSEALAEAMLQVLWDDEFRSGILRRAHDYLESVAAATTVRRLEAVILETVEGHRSASRVP